MSFTAAQTEAIRARGNVVVAAGAGTGKTRTLVERCLSCLVEDRPRASLDELLVVTFTEAAATEVRQRIRSRLVEELEQFPDEPHWREQLALFETAQIGTLHSFCFQLVRRHFYQLKLDPQLSVLAAEESRLLAEETLDALLQKHYEGAGPVARAVQELIQVQGRGADKVIRRLILRLHEYTQTLPDPAGWLNVQAKTFEAAKPLSWQIWLEEALATWRERWLPALEEAAENSVAGQCAQALRPLAAPKTDSRSAEILQAVLAFREECPHGKKGRWIDPLEGFFGETAFLASLFDRAAGPNPLQQDWDWVRHSMGTLLALALEFARAFTETKRELGVLDFHDLEQYALELLWDRQLNQPTEVAQHWRNQLRFLFVDEYQDINAAQDKIIEALSRQGPRANRFLVGDVKQSIYRFRLANPHIFQSYVQRWQTEGKVVALSENFRSRERLLNFINSLFEDCMRPELGGVAYDDQARLRCGGTKHPSSAEPGARLCAGTIPGAPSEPGRIPPVELHLRLKSRSPGQEPHETTAEIQELEDSAKEARLLALRLRTLKAAAQPIWDEKQKEFRPLDWRDIAILLRSPANKAQTYAMEFGRLNVPLQVARGGFYNSLEISDLLSLLQLLDNPLQDLPLLAVLHSPLVGLTAPELAIIRLAAKGTRFWTALVRWQQARDKAGPETQSRCREAELQAPEFNFESPNSDTKGPEGTDARMLQKVSAFLQRFGRWRRLARQLPVSQCLEAILSETHYSTWLLTQPQGQQRAANIQRLLGLAQKFDQFQRQGLFRFLKLTEAQRGAEAEPEMVPIAEQNAVQLMSIHQSKGLEFPMVVVADLGKPFNLADLGADIILDEVYGLCPLVRPPHTGKRYPSLPYWLARQRQRSEVLGEELRLLYVAMTRARELLVLSASVSEKSFKERWLNAPDDSKTSGVANHGTAGPTSAGAAIPTATLLSARNYADWLGLWFSRHCGTGTSGRPNPKSERGQQKPPDATTRSCPAAVAQNPSESPLVEWFVHEDSELAQAAPRTTTGQPGSELTLEPEDFERLRSRLCWRYPFWALTSQPAKSSVSALRRQAVADEESTPMFGNGARVSLSGKSLGISKPRSTAGGLSAVEIGNAHHAFLQRVSLEQTSTVQELKTEARRLLALGDLDPEELPALNFEHLAAFWNSEPGRSIRQKGPFVRRELPFTARFSSADLARISAQPPGPEFQEEFVVVQGVVDLAVILPAEIWLLDFKTDALSRNEVPARTAAYEPQLRIYAEALSRIYRLPVSRSWLYFLDCEQAIPLPLARAPLLPD